MFRNFGEAIDVHNKLEATIRELPAEEYIYQQYLEARLAEVSKFIGIHVVIAHNVGHIDIRKETI